MAWRQLSSQQPARKWNVGPEPSARQKGDGGASAGADSANPLTAVAVAAVFDDDRPPMRQGGHSGWGGVGWGVGVGGGDGGGGCTGGWWWWVYR